MDAITLASIFPLEEIWGSAVGFVTIAVFSIGAIGLGARSLAIGACGGYTAFVYFTTTANIPQLDPILYISLAIVIIGISMKLWRAEGLPGGST